MFGATFSRPGHPAALLTREISGNVVTHPAALRNFTWEKRCGGLFELLVAARVATDNPARKLKRAQILLAADAGAARVVAGGSTVTRTKRRFVEGNLELALAEELHPGAALRSSSGI